MEDNEALESHAGEAKEELLVSDSGSTRRRKNSLKSLKTSSNRKQGQAFTFSALVSTCSQPSAEKIRSDAQVRPFETI